MKKLSILFILFLISICSYSQRVFKTYIKNEANVSVYVVNSEDLADLKVFDTQKRIQSKGNKGVWYFEDREKRAKKKVFFTDNINQSDIKIIFVDKKRKAGWLNNNKKHLFY